MCLTLTPLSFSASKMEGGTMRAMRGAPADIKSPTGEWEYVAYVDDKEVARICGKPASWGSEGGVGIDEVWKDGEHWRQELKGGCANCASRAFEMATRAIQEEKPEAAWLALNNGFKLPAEDSLHHDHPLTAALGKKRGAKGRRSKKSSAKETRGWVDLCLAHGASLHSAPKGKLSIGENSMLNDGDVSRTLCAELGVDLAALLDKKFAELRYDDTGSRELLVWALSSGDDRWHAQIKKSKAVWARPRSSTVMSYIEMICKNELRDGSAVPLIAAKSLSGADFSAERVFAEGACEWIMKHKFDACKSGGSAALNKGLLMLAEWEKMLGFEGIVEASFARGVLEGMLGNHSAVDQLDKMLMLDAVDAKKVLKYIVEDKATLRDLGEFEFLMLKATGATAIEIKDISQGWWDSDASRRLALEVEKEQAFILRREMLGDVGLSASVRKTRNAL